MNVLEYTKAYVEALVDAGISINGGHLTAFAARVHAHVQALEETIAAQAKELEAKAAQTLSAETSKGMADLWASRAAAEASSMKAQAVVQNGDATPHDPASAEAQAAPALNAPSWRQDAGLAAVAAPETTAPLSQPGS